MKGKEIWKEAMDILRKRMLFADELSPGLMVSAGAHIANLYQRNNPFFLPGGVPEDCRVSAVVVAPSGFSKSFTMKLFMDPTMGFLPFPSAFRGKITEAGFIGTVNSEGEEIRGEAFRFREGIIGFNEITNVFAAQLQEHSPELINQMMEALTEARVSKTLANGSFTYQTWVTIWGGVQPKRFDFSAGLSRRFIFISKRWSADDRYMLKERMFPGGESDLSAFRETQEQVKDLKERISVMAQNFNPTTVSIDEKLWKWMMESANNHIQMLSLIHISEPTRPY